MGAIDPLRMCVNTTAPRLRMQGLRTAHSRPLQTHSDVLAITGMRIFGSAKQTGSKRRPYPAGRGWDEIAFPSANDEHAYALEISGDSMMPAYRDGDVIVVSPAAPIRRGDRVVVKTKAGELTVKELNAGPRRRSNCARSILPIRNAPCRRATWCGSRASSGRASKENPRRAYIRPRRGGSPASAGLS
jgi:hypothetical protein